MDKANDSGPLRFGDNVRIKETPGTLTEAIAGLDGVIYGFTTPSLSGVSPVGELADDFAWNVHIDALQKGFWLDPGDIELVSRPEVMEFSVAGKTIRVTQKDGVYKEEILGEEIAKASPWWKFW